MTFRGKQFIDFWLGGLLLLLLFVPLFVLGRILRRDHSLDQRRGCVVVKMVGAGSLFLAAPSLQAIRGQFPAGGFFLIGTRGVTGFAETFGWFDECLTIDDSSLWRLIASTTRALVRIGSKCDHLIDLEVHSRLTTVFGVLSAVRNRIGFVDEVVFWRRGFYTHMTYFNAQGPVYSFYDLLAAWFGIDRVPVRQVNAAFRSRVLSVALPPPVILPDRYVVVAPGCSDFGKERQLHADEWRDLLTRSCPPGAAIFVLGAAADRPLADAIILAIGRGRSLCGDLGISESAAVLARAEHFFGIDSLLLHLARALNVPTTSVWGPSNPATRLRPGGAGDEIYYAEMCCSPCIHVHETPPCSGARACMPAALARSSHLLHDDRARRSIGWVTYPLQRSPHLVEVAYD